MERCKNCPLSLVICPLQMTNTSLLRLRLKRSYAAGFTTTPFDYQEDKLSTSD
ncbi:MAG: hypothetical protein V7L20_21680 [Nostoc sp.]